MNVKELQVPKLQISWDTETRLPTLGEDAANRWGLKLIRSILPRGVLYPQIVRTTYIIELRPQAEFFGVFDPEALAAEIESVVKRYAKENIEPILNFA